MSMADAAARFAGVYSPAFHAALQHVLKFEGGWSDHPEDPGGKTYAGITLGLFRKWRNNPSTPAEALRAITPEEVYEIYHTMFWRAVNGDKLPPAIAALVFDAAVNSGPKNAVLALQRSINAWKSAPFKMAEDGVLGPKSVAAANALDIKGLVTEFGARRMIFYGALKTFRAFGFGWSRRLMAGLALAQSLITVGKAVADALNEGKET